MTKGVYKPKVWTEELKDWLVKNTDKISNNAAWELFHKTFPEVQTTRNSLASMRTQLRIGNVNSEKRGKPLYSEIEKKGYIRIKVQMSPAKFVQKQKWVYIETHPEEIGDIEETDSFYFADGDTRNFDWKNILRVKRKEQFVFFQCGGVVKGNPEATRINLARAKLKIATLDAGEKIGKTVSYNGGRYFKSVLNERMVTYRQKLKSTEEGCQKLKEINKRRWQRRKAKRTQEQREKIKVYQREWVRKKKMREKEEL